jgi:hypothetical protein
VNRELGLISVVPDQFLPWFPSGCKTPDQEFCEEGFRLRFGVDYAQPTFSNGQGEGVPFHLGLGGHDFPPPNIVPYDSSHLATHVGIRVLACGQVPSRASSTWLATSTLPARERLLWLQHIQLPF